MKRKAFFLAALFAIATAAGPTNKLTFRWDANIEPDIAGYRIYHGLGTNAFFEMVDVGKVTTNTWTFTNGLPAGTNRFAVTAYNTAALESGPSAPVFVSTPGIPSNVVLVVTATIIQTNVVVPLP